MGMVSCQACFARWSTGRVPVPDALTHELVDAIPSYATVAARLAEQISHMLARTSPGKITLTTPLSRANTANTQTRGARSAHRQGTAAPLGRRTCQSCGDDLYGSARKLCPTCWPVARNEQIRQLGFARARPLANSPVDRMTGGVTLQEYREHILPALSQVSLADMERTIGLTNPSCSRVRRGLQIPHSRHWRALADLAGYVPLAGDLRIN
jgi:hypothetical protein